MKRSGPVKLLLVGCGSAGSGIHLPALEMLRRDNLVQVVGVCDVVSDRAERLAQAAEGVVGEWGTDWRALAARTRPDAVSVCLPPGANAEVSVGALEAGLHVICEKPPGRTVEHAEAMAEAAARVPERVTMVAFNRRFAPLFVKAFEAGQRLGSPHTFYGRFTRACLGEAPSDTAGDWITSDAAHVLDLACATLGLPESMGVTRARVGSGPDNVWTLQLHATSGAAVLVFDFAAGHRSERIAFSGPGYDVDLELPAHGRWAQSGSEIQEWDAAEVTGTTSRIVNYGYPGEYRAFLSAIRGEAPRPACDFAYGARFMHLVREILASGSPVGRRVPVRGGGRGPRTRNCEGNVSRPATCGTRAPRPTVGIWQDPATLGRFFDEAGLARLRERCELRLRVGQGPGSLDLGSTDALVVGWHAPSLSPELLSRAGRLKLVIVLGASVKAACPSLLVERGVALCSTADAVAGSVAEYCLLGALAGLRRLVDVDRAMHRGLWPPGRAARVDPRAFFRRLQHLPGAAVFRPLAVPVINRLWPPGPTRTRSTGLLPWSDLRGQTVGLVGWGHTARHFARLLEPLGCEILVYSSAATVEELRAHGGRPGSLGEVMGASRVVSIHRGLSETTRGMIGATELGLLRPGTVLINTARGPIVREEALLKRLRKGDIVAVLDVFDTEPLHVRDPLRRLSNVILTPHSASRTNECYRRVGAQARALIEDWLNGRPLPALPPERLPRAT